MAIYTLLLSAPAAVAQQKGKKVEAWELHYGVQMEAMNNDTTQKEQLASLQLAQALMSGNPEEPALRCYLTDHLLRVETTGLMAAVTVMDKRDSVYYQIDSTFKKAYRHSSSMPEIETRMVGDSLVVIDPDDFEIKMLEDTSTLLGWPCRKALFTNREMPDQQIQVWYTERLPRLYWGKYKYLQQLPGCALAVFTVQGNLLLGIRAEKIRRTTLPEALFMPPAGYEVEDVSF